MNNIYIKLSKIWRKENKVISLFLAIAMMLANIPASILQAWDPPATITINKSADAAYFTNQWGTPMESGFYYAAGTGELAYCADQEASGPGGTGYSLDDPGLGNEAYLRGIQAIIQHGYPYVTNGLSAEDARYATQVAIHWTENFYLGPGQGWDASIRSATDANGHDGALAMALALFDIGVNQAQFYPKVVLDAPSDWRNGSLTITANETDTEFWSITSLPSGVSATSGMTYAGDQVITLKLSDPAAFAVSDKKISVQGYSNRDTSNIHVFTTAGGYQSMVCVSTQMNSQGDPSDTILPDAGTYIRLYKTTNRGDANRDPESGAVFQIFSSSYASFAEAPDAVRDTLTADIHGQASTKVLPYGNYIIRQTVAPTGTWLAAARTVTLDSTVRNPLVSIENTTATGTVQIQKSTDRHGEIVAEPGAVFQVYLTSSGSYAASRNSERDQITTGPDGHASTKLLPYGNYTLRQIAPAPVGTILNTGSWTFDVGTDSEGEVISGDTDSINVINDAAVGSLEIFKTTNRIYAEIPEPGASFQIWNSEYSSFSEAPETEKTTITTDGDGHAVTGDLPYGTYNVHQSVVPAGTKAAADFSARIGDVSGAVVTKNITDETFWGDIEVVKSKAAPSDPLGTRTPEADAVFRVYPSVYASYDEARAMLSPEGNSFLTDEFSTDMAGIGRTTHKFPYGEYTVEQIDSPATLLTFKADSWNVMIGEADNQTYSYLVNNEIYEQYLQIVKTDVETGDEVRLSGATFRIFASDGMTVLSDKNGVSEFTTDENGRISLLDMPFQVGNYFIQEVRAPKGFVLNPEMKPFAVSITDHGSSSVTVNLGLDSRTENFGNAPQTCGLIIEKQGETLTSAIKTEAVAENGAQYSDEEGNPLSIYRFGYSSTGMAGAVFEVSVGAADILDQDGDPKWFDADEDGIKELRLTTGTVIGTITTAAGNLPDGRTQYLATLAGLPLDSLTGTAQYLAREIKAPEGVTINPDIIVFDFTYGGQTLSQISQQKLVTDERQKVEVTVEKMKEQAIWNESVSDYDRTLVAAQDILFGLYAGEDIYDSKGSLLVPADDLVDVLFTGTDGHAKTSQDLPFGNYCLKELNVTPDILWDPDAVCPVTASPLADQSVPVASFAANSGQPIINREISGYLDVYKIAADTRLPMSGVIFEIYDSSGHLVNTVTTDDTGHAMTRLLPYGRYTIKETQTIAGYALAESQTFSIYLEPKAGEQYPVHELIITDEKMAEIRIRKLTGDGTSTPMSGVVFGIYETSTDTEAARITTDMAGEGSAYVPAGSYYMKELSTWDGFALQPDRIPVDAEWASVHTFCLTNNPTEFVIRKTGTNSDTGLPGTQFRITDNATGSIINVVWDEKLQAYIPSESKVLGANRLTEEITAVTTGADGTASVLFLPAGSYMVTEVRAPDGYLLDSNPMTVQVGTDLKTVYTFRDKKVPKTGESGSRFRNVAGIGCIVLSGAILSSFALRRRNRIRFVSPKD